MSRHDEGEYTPVLPIPRPQWVQQIQLLQDENMALRESFVQMEMRAEKAETRLDALRKAVTLLLRNLTIDDRDAWRWKELDGVRALLEEKG